MVADVPVGVFLSGGVDSSAVAALASEAGTRSLLTLTLSFEQAEFDEGREARCFASKIGSDHHEFRVTARDFREQIFNFLGALDQPTADGFNSYLISRAARHIGLRAILSGAGGDELFFGYRHYRGLVQKAGLLGLYAHAPSLVRVMTARAASTLSAMGGREQWSRFSYYGGRSLNESLYLLVRGFFSPAQAAELLGMSLAEIDSAVDRAFAPLRIAGENGTVDAARFQELEMRRYLHDQLLRDSDLFSMAHSVEVRLPLVDHEVVQAARSIPLDSQIADGINKPALVEAVPGVPLREIATKPKRSFTLPLECWLKQHAAELADFASQGSFLNRKAVAKTWSRFRGGRAHWSRAWSTIVLRAIAG
jgi:asparagine synthase (glutamine-hydrolysing)